MSRTHNIHALDFIRVNVSADFRLEAAQNRLGIFWWFMEPLMMMAIFYTVFGLILERGGEGFVYYLLVGISSWLWFAATVTRTMHSITRSARLIQQIYIPKYLLPCVAVCVECLKSFIVFGLLLLLLAGLNGITFSWFYLPVIFITQLLFSAACGVVMAALVPFVNDLKFVVQLGLRALMFLSGVFFLIDDRIPEPYASYLMLNPMANIITEFRSVLVDDTAPTWTTIASINGLSIALLVIGFALIKHFDRRYPRVLL